MRAGLLTLDSKSYNYGGALQQYALLKCITSFCHSVEIIDYDNKSENNTFSYKRNLKYLTPEKLIHRLKHVMSLKKRDGTVLTNESRVMFDDFREEFLVLSKRYTRKNIVNTSDEYDIFVCGSDQIWNPSFNLPSFFLDFVSGDKKKIIYAASVGVPGLTKMQKRIYKEMMGGLDYISVREHEAQGLIQPLTDKKVELVLDPTLLLTKEEWMDTFQSRNRQTSYVFCYFLGIDGEKVSAAKEFAKKNHLEIISIPFQNRMFSENEFPTCPEGIGPKEFLEKIYNAEFVLTDSFHASVFSVIFNKAFRVFTRTAGKTNLNGRIRTLLHYIGKEDFLIKTEELSAVKISNGCVYDTKEIEEMRKRSLQWLGDAIQDGAE